MVVVGRLSLYCLIVAPRDTNATKVLEFFGATDGHPEYSPAPTGGHPIVHCSLARMKRIKGLPFKEMNEQQGIIVQELSVVSMLF
jgi:hypothetical protein